MFICGKFSPHGDNKNAWKITLRILNYTIQKIHQNVMTHTGEIAILSTNNPTHTRLTTN
jgi:hypothetical protein